MDFSVNTNYWNMTPMPFSMGSNGSWNSPVISFQMMQDMQRQMFESQQRLLKLQEQFESSKPNSTSTPASNAAANAEQMPEIKLNDFVNAGDVVPMTKQSVEARATAYRRSDKFGELLTSEQTEFNHSESLKTRIQSIQSERQKLDALNKELANVTSENPIKETETIVEPKFRHSKKARIRKRHTKTVEKPLRDAKDVEKDIKAAQRAYDKKAISMQTELIKAKKAKLAETKSAIRGIRKQLGIHKANGRWERFGNFAQKHGWKKLSDYCKGKVRTVQPKDALNATLKQAKDGQKLLKGNLKAIKSGGSSAKWAGRAGWALAIALEGYDVYKVADKHGFKSKQTAKKTASAAAGLGGAWAGAKAGAFLGAKLGGVIGSFFPGAGNIIGAGIGAFVGGLVGGAAGYWAAQKASDYAFDQTMGKTEYKA